MKREYIPTKGVNLLTGYYRFSLPHHSYLGGLNSWAKNCLLNTVMKFWLQTFTYWISTMKKGVLWMGMINLPHSCNTLGYVFCYSMLLRTFRDTLHPCVSRGCKTARDQKWKSEEIACLRPSLTFIQYSKLSCERPGPAILFKNLKFWLLTFCIILSYRDGQQTVVSVVTYRRGVDLLQWISPILVSFLSHLSSKHLFFTTKKLFW